MPDSPRKTFNPFYPLLVVAGVVFCITACAYGVMTVRKLRNPLEENPPHFIQWIDGNGFSLMMWELGGLAVLTVAAMAADSFATKPPQRSAPSGGAATSNTEIPGRGDAGEAADSKSPADSS